MELNRAKWDEQAYKNFTEYLLANKKPGLSEFSSKLIPTKYPIIGVPSPVMKSIIKEIVKGDFAGFIKHSKTDFFEQVGTLGQVIVTCKCDAETRKKYLRHYLELVDNWALNDSASAAFKALEKQHAEYFDFLKGLLGGGTYQIRFALCCFMNYYLGDEYIDAVLKFTNDVTSKEYYVMMQQAWLVSVAFVKQRGKCLAFLENNGLDKITQNKAIQKIRESNRVSKEDKEMLISLKRK